MTVVIAIESLIPTEQLAEMKETIASAYVGLVEENVIPLILNTVNLTHTTLKPTVSEVSVTANYDEATNTVLGFNKSLTLGLEFIPARTYDMFEEVQREIARGLYAGAIERLTNNIAALDAQEAVATAETADETV
jgi:hypothetical protein